jgi:hypothetical protein
MSLKAYIDLNHGFAIEKNTLSGGAFPNVDPDALAWFNAVEATGANFGSSPASITSNKAAFNTAFLSLKSNGIWSAIRQACFLVGPSTIAGALVNIKLTGNPVNYNFTSEHYNKLQGLIGSLGGESNNTRYLDTLLNDSTDINGLDFHMLVQKNNTYGSIGIQREYIFGSNNDYGETGGDINIYTTEGSDRINPNSFDFSGVGNALSIGFSRNGGGVTFNKFPTGWGTYNIDYADYFSGRNFLLYKTGPSQAQVDSQYRGRISFYSIGTSTNVQALIPIIDQLTNALVN